MTLVAIIIIGLLLKVLLALAHPQSELSIESWTPMVSDHHPVPTLPMHQHEAPQLLVFERKLLANLLDTKE